MEVLGPLLCLFTPVVLAFFIGFGVGRYKIAIVRRDKASLGGFAPKGQ